MPWGVLVDVLATMMLGGLCGMALFPLLVHWRHPAIAHKYIARPEDWPRVRGYCLAIIGVFVCWFVIHNILGLV